MITLPITHIIPLLKQKLQAHNQLILQAPPGAGKTTALPLALLDEPWLKGKKIIMLEPRRLAVRASAFRMAEILGEKVGERIGYQVKMDSKQSQKTQILIVTEGILTRKLQHDPSLEDVALIIFDEFHERSLHADLSLALSLESQTVLREDLKLLIMSATLNTSAIHALLPDAPLLTSEGRSFPIERIYLDANSPEPSKKELPFYVHKRLLKIITESSANILVFLSGVREIKTVERLLKESQLKNIVISPLYGNLSKEQQDQAIKSPKNGERKVVLSTNIAQTSLTIDDIGIVVDSGIENISVFNPFTGMNKLERRFISQDAASQRAGRAGRLFAGTCYHLWHKSKILQEHDTPEILQADLTQLLLSLALWGDVDTDAYAWIDTPPISAISHAKKLLIQLGALDKEEKATPHAQAMSQFGMHPRLAHMLIRAKELGLSYEASLLAVLISEKDIYQNSYATCDIKERVLTLHDVAQKKAIHHNFVDIKQCHYLLKNAKRIEPLTKKHINLNALGFLLAFAYPERIAKVRQARAGAYLLANGKEALLNAQDALFGSPFLVLADLDAKKTNAPIYKAIAINKHEIEEYFSELISKQEVATWNDEAQKVELQYSEKIGSITLTQRQLTQSNNPEIVEVLLEELEEAGLGVLNWDKETIQLLNRVNFLNHHGLEFPNFSNDYLKENLQAWLSPYICGMNSFRDLKGLKLHPIMIGQLSYQQIQILELKAPSKLKVASGSLIAINYTDPSQPILAVRLQEMFGTEHTPSILEGKVPLMLHLLSPASRPMQITKDLKSFWENTYEDVKKELRGKYKKHYWPDNPLEAQATSKTKKRM